MINVQQGMKNKKKYVYIKNLKNYKTKQYGPESIRDFKKSGNLLKWTHKSGAMNLSGAIMYSLLDSITSVFSFSLRPFDPKRNVSTIVTSFWFNKERLVLLTLSKKGFL